MTTDRRSLFARLTSSPLVWPLLGLLALLLFNAIFTPSFFHLEIRDGHLYGSIVDVFNRGSIGILLATGMTLVIAGPPR